MKKYLREGGVYPLFYASAYRDWDRDQLVCYPIPIHLVVRVYRDFVMRAREWWRPSYREELEILAFRKGWHVGWEVGVSIGRREGADGLRTELLAQFDAKYGTRPE